MVLSLVQIKKSSPTKTTTQKLKSGFSMFSSQEIYSSLLSFEMILEVQTELFRLKLHSLSSKLKIPGMQPKYNENVPWLSKLFSERKLVRA